MTTGKITRLASDNKSGKMEVENGSIEKFHNILLTNIKVGDKCEYTTISGNDGGDTDVFAHILTKKIPT